MTSERPQMTLPVPEARNQPLLPQTHNNRSLVFYEDDLRTFHKSNPKNPKATSQVLPTDSPGKLPGKSPHFVTDL